MPLVDVAQNQVLPSARKHPATQSHIPEIRRLADGIGKSTSVQDGKILNGNGNEGAMRQGPNNKRMRGRGNSGRKGGNPRSQSFESNGPDVKVRGNAQQVVEKYLTLARDASSAGDRINAESYYQFAEHYYRIMNANAANEQQQRAQQQQQNANQDSESGDAQGANAADAKAESAAAEDSDATASQAQKADQNGRSRRRNPRRANNARSSDKQETQTESDVVATDDKPVEEAGEGANA